MTEQMGRGLAAICYGVAGLMAAGFLYAFDSDTAKSLGAAAIFAAGLVVFVGLIRLGRAFGRIED